MIKDANRGPNDGVRASGRCKVHPPTVLWALFLPWKRCFRTGAPPLAGWAPHPHGQETSSGGRTVLAPPPTYLRKEGLAYLSLGPPPTFLLALAPQSSKWHTQIGLLPGPLLQNPGRILCGQPDPHSSQCGPGTSSIISQELVSKPLFPLGSHCCGFEWQLLGLWYIMLDSVLSNPVMLWVIFKRALLFLPPWV